jgi:hypothetical protein
VAKKEQKMIKNIIIAIETLIILGLAVIIYTTSYQHKEAKAIPLPEIKLVTEAKVIRFPEIKLETNERITGAEMIFQSAYIKSIRNIPPEWGVDIDLNTPPNPIFKGSILVGVAALGSTKELPEIEVDNYSKEIEPKALKAVFNVTKYPPGNPEAERRVEIEMNKP